MRTVAVVQARVGSTRLPNKVLMEVLPGHTVLDLVIERLRVCRTLDAVVIAAPESRANDPVADRAFLRGAEVWRGSECDVLTRYLEAGRAFGADIVVRVTSDCPLIDPGVVDLHVERLRSGWNRVDFVTNMMRPTFPLGVSVEAMPLDTLARMDRLSGADAHLREHVTTIAYEQPAWFLTDRVEDDQDRSHMRWTVDYPADLTFVRAVYRDLPDEGLVFPREVVYDLLARRPDIGLINVPAPA